MNFTWGTGAIAGSATDTAGVRWAGRILSHYTEIFEFELRTDRKMTEQSTSGDGARLWVDGLVVIDWFEEPRIVDGDRGEYEGGGTASVNLTAGMLHDVIIEYRYSSRCDRG